LVFANDNQRRGFFGVHSKNGSITSPIGTPAHPDHSAKAEQDKRLLTRLLNRNKGIQHSREERERMHKLDIAERNKILEKRQKKHDQLLSEIEIRKNVLQQAKRDPSVLDKLMAQDPKGGVLPAQYKRIQDNKRDEYFEKQRSRIRKETEANTVKVNEITQESSELERKIAELEKQHAELREESKKPLANPFETTKKTNDIVFKINEVKQRLAEKHKAREQYLEESRKMKEEDQNIAHIREASPFGSAGNKSSPDTLTILPNATYDEVVTGYDSEGNPLYENKKIIDQFGRTRWVNRTDKRSIMQKREDSNRQYAIGRYGIGTSKAFPLGTHEAVKQKNPRTGKTEWVSANPNAVWTGQFDAHDKPIFIDPTLIPGNNKKYNRPSDKVFEARKEARRNAVENVNIVPAFGEI